MITKMTKFPKMWDNPRTFSCCNYYSSMSFPLMRRAKLDRRLRQMLTCSWPHWLSSTLVCTGSQRLQSFRLTAILHRTKLITSVKLDCVALRLSNDNITALAYWYTQAIRGEITEHGESYTETTRRFITCLRTENCLIFHAVKGQGENWQIPGRLNGRALSNYWPPDFLSSRCHFIKMTAEKEQKNKQTPRPLVRERTIPTDRPPLVDEI
jgi:hypothetical protein